jgi:hypothetical protein
MTVTEIISTVFSRNVSEDHFTDSDILLAKQAYVDKYIQDYDEDSVFYIDYCRPVIAYGVVVNTFHRFTSEITDRGLVEMISDGARTINPENKMAVLREFENTLHQKIDEMLGNCEAAGATILNDDLASYCPIALSENEYENEL